MGGKKGQRIYDERIRRQKGTELMLYSKKLRFQSREDTESVLTVNIKTHLMYFNLMSGYKTGT